MSQNLWEDLKISEGTKNRAAQTYEGIFWGKGSEYLLFWQCAIVEIRCFVNVPLSILNVLAICQTR
jgi:hypothetical protein